LNGVFPTWIQLLVSFLKQIQVCKQARDRVYVPLLATLILAKRERLQAEVEIDCGPVPILCHERVDIAQTVERESFS
jgi:hypothetical protein